MYIVKTFKRRGNKRNKSLTQTQLNKKDTSIEEFKENLFLYRWNKFKYF